MDAIGLEFGGGTMAAPRATPTLEEIKSILAWAERCLECNAPECHEFTPEGVDVCAQLPWWNGEPVRRETLVEWDQLVRQLEFANR